MSDVAQVVTDAVIRHLRDNCEEWWTAEQVAAVLRSSKEITSEYAEDAYERNADEDASDLQTKRRDGFQYLAWEALNELSNDSASPVMSRVEGDSLTAEFKVDAHVEPDIETVSEEVELLSKDESEIDLPAPFERHQDAPLPEAYKRARAYLRRCESVDECAEWENKFRALESYARQSEDEELINMARRIRLRGSYQAGELLEQYQSKGGRPSKTGDGAGPSSDKEPQSQREAAKRAGLSERQEKTVRRIANVDRKEFEEAVECDDPPSLTAMALRGMESTSNTDDEGEASTEPDASERAADWLQEMLERVTRWFRVHDPAEVRSELGETAIETIEDQIEEVLSWLRRFLTAETDTDGRDTFGSAFKELHGAARRESDEDPRPALLERIAELLRRVLDLSEDDPDFPTTIVESTLHNVRRWQSTLREEGSGGGEG